MRSLTIGAPLTGPQREFRLPLGAAATGLALSAALVVSPLYTIGALIVLAWLIVCFTSQKASVLAIALTIASPPFLYLDRVNSTFVVDGLICGALVIFLLTSRNLNPGYSKETAGHFSERQLALEKTARQVDRATLAFTGYMLLNFVWALHAGNDRAFAVNELIPVAEMYACYWIAVRVDLTDKGARQLLYLTLALATARGAWQILLVITGNAGSLTPPVFSRSEEAEQVIAGVLITKLIDPMQGLCLPAAFGVWLLTPAGALRRIALAAVAVTFLVLILSLERAEWIAAIVCLCLVIYLVFRRAARSLRRAALVSAAIVLAIALGFISLRSGSLNFGEILQTRLIDYTRQQVFDPHNSLQMVRLLEFKTAADAFAESPVIGQGLGRGLGTTVGDAYGTEFVPIHNYYLNLLANGGLVGVGLLCYLALRVGKALFVAYRSADGAFDQAFVLFTLAGMLWYAIFIVFHPVYSAYHIPALLGVFTGTSVVRMRKSMLNQSRLGRDGTFISASRSDEGTAPPSPPAPES